MNKHVKMDKFITFPYCTVICDVLRPIDVIFWKDNTNCIWFFCVSNFFKVGKFAAFSERPKLNVFQLQSPPWTCDQGLCPWTPLGAPLPNPLL